MVESIRAWKQRGIKLIVDLILTRCVTRAIRILDDRPESHNPKLAGVVAVYDDKRH